MPIQLHGVTGISTTGNIIANGNITADGTLTVGTFIGNISSASNISGGNLLTAGLVSATGNVIGGNITTSGLVSATGNITGGNLIISGRANVTGNVTAGNLVTSGRANVSGNVIGGNLITTGVASVTGNVTAGNLVTSGRATVTGNVTGGNLITGGLVTVTGNVTGGNIDTVGMVSATGNVVGGNVTTGGLITATGNVTGDWGNFSSVDAGNVEVTNIKARDGTAAASIADSTGIISITSNPILSGGTANGVLYLNGSKVATSGSALIFDGTNLGLGVTPSAWGGAYRALQLTDGVAFAEGGGDTYVANNWYNNGTNNLYIANGLATLYGQSGGTHKWYNAASGTAGNTISFTQAMTLDASGNLGVGITSPTSRLHLKGPPGSNPNTNGVVFQASGSTNNFGAIGIDNSTGDFVVASGSGAALRFYTNSDLATTNERARITSDGNFGVDNTNPSYRLDVGISGRGSGANYDTNSMALSSIERLFGYENDLSKAATLTLTQFNSSASIACGYTSTFQGFLAFGTSRASDGQVVERARITSGGDFGIGTSSPGAKLDVSSAGVVAARINNTASSSDAYLICKNTSGESFFGVNATGPYIYTATAQAMTFLTNNAERARITSGGYLLVGTTSTAADARLVVNNPDNVSGDFCFVTYLGSNCNDTSSYHYIASTGGTDKLYIYGNGNIVNANNSYGTLSDAKMKTDIVDAGSQWADIKAVRFRKFKMKNDPTGLVQLGVVAQELEQTSPGLVDEHPDYEEVEITEEDGNVKKERQPTGTTTKSVKTSVLLMKAAVALQEAMARIEQLEAKVAALESKGV